MYGESVATETTTTKFNLPYRIIKRLFDIFVGIIGCFLLIPMTLIIKALYVFDGDFYPIFYTQPRIGKHGKYFKLYKFRSMCPNADDKLNKILKENRMLRKVWEENQKLSNDPRITKVGKIIRKTSIDEFPQFINVDTRWLICTS